MVARWIAVDLRFIRLGGEKKKRKEKSEKERKERREGEKKKKKENQRLPPWTGGSRNPLEKSFAAGPF